MSNELDLYQNNDLAPYSPGTGLAPITPADDWGITDVDYFSERPAFAPDVAPEMQQVLQQIGAVISGDLLKLGHPVAWVNATLNWYQKNIGNPPQPVQRRHNFNLHDQAGDPLAESFGNHCKVIDASQEFVSNCLWLLGQMQQRLTGNAVPAQGRAHTGTSAEAILDSLDDKTYDFVVKHNANVAGQTEAYLRAKWKDSYTQNIALANSYLANLPASHQAHFDQFEPGTWTLSLNSATTIEGLFQMAVGGNNLPTGSALQTEIMQIENFMRENRKAYNRDLQIQGRLRTLYSIRDGS